MIYFPYDTSPWGEVQQCRPICAGVYTVSTAGHGGIMVLREVAERIFTKEAQECGFLEGGYLCFEEDCDAAVAIRELLDKGLMKAPVNEHYKEGEYSEVIDRVVQQWNPEYWVARSEWMKAEQKTESSKDKNNDSREER